MHCGNIAFSENYNDVCGESPHWDMRVLCFRLILLVSLTLSLHTSCALLLLKVVCLRVNCDEAVNVIVMEIYVSTMRGWDSEYSLCNTLKHEL